MDDWVTFYAERRLRPALRLARDSGCLSAVLTGQVERIIERLPDLCGPPVEPTLLHGDAQQNNWISTSTGPVAIDPAVHYGHPEMDLACLDIFQTVPEEVLAGYSEVQPIDPGFPERRSLWRTYGYLYSVAVEGACYVPPLEAAVQAYL
jgi:fructosamine-3-kinase